MKSGSVARIRIGRPLPKLSQSFAECRIIEAELCPGHIHFYFVPKTFAFLHSIRDSRDSVRDTIRRQNRQTKAYNK